MKIHNNFTGGNIFVEKQEGNDIYLKNELRDSLGDWFYWAFCIEGAEGKTLTFHFQENRLGYFGPAVSFDLKEWHWLNSVGENTFTYKFGENESKVYFAHSMLYHPQRFLDFAQRKGLTIKEFCKSGKGRSVPALFLGEGKRSIILTARHHACESTGNYVLEGVLDELTDNMLSDTKVLCVPFVDYDGVVDGDQGKNRAPHDHNRDYDVKNKSIYASTAAIRDYAEENGCHYGFDFHSPWHKSGENDHVFIVQNLFEKTNRFNEFGELLESENNESSLKYYHKDDYPFMTGWNMKNTSFSMYVSQRKENELAFSLETAYFGTQDNKVSQASLVELGKCFARAIRHYINNFEGKIKLDKSKANKT